MDGLDWTGLDGLDGWMDPAEKPSPLRAPAVLINNEKSGILVVRFVDQIQKYVCGKHTIINQDNLCLVSSQETSVHCRATF